MIIPRAKIQISCLDLGKTFLGLLNPLNDRQKCSPIVEKFASSFAAQFNREYGVAFCKARMGFYHTLKALDLEPGSEVMITPMHIADFINIIRLCGLKPVVVDLEPDSFHIDCEDLKQKITPKTKVLLLTYLYGYAMDMEKILEILDKNNITLLEDCSQALLTEDNGKPVGTFGKAAIFSLSLLKPVSTFNGGVVVTSDKELAAKLKEQAANQNSPAKIGVLVDLVKNVIFKVALSGLIFSKIVLPLLKKFSDYSDFFSKYQKTNKSVSLRQSLPSSFFTRFSDAQARLGIEMLKKYKSGELIRKKIGLSMYDKLESSSSIILPKIRREAENGFWLFPVLVENPEELKKHLLKQNIDSSPILLSLITSEEAFKHFEFSAPNADRTHSRVLFLPIYPQISVAASDVIIDSVIEYSPK